MSVIKFPTSPAAHKPTHDLYLTFFVGQESYAIHQTRVHEIVRQRPLIAAPWMSPCIHGLVQLRHTALPVVDLRRKFGLRHIEATEHTSITIATLDTAESVHPRIGIVVDRIAEKIHLQPHQIEETPEFKISSDTAFVRGLAYIKGTMRMLLDVDWLLARERFACEAHG